MTMMELVEFDRRLRVLSPGAWPFVCDGSPLDCAVFLVGINPRSDTDFWSCWDPIAGFQREAWLAAYLRESEFTRTRRRINALVELLPIKCLETNVFCATSSTPKVLSREERDTRVFDFLLEAIRPRVVLVHGRPPRRHLERVTRVRLPLGAVTIVETPSSKMSVLATRHLSRLSTTDFDGVGRALRRCALRPVAP